MENELRAPIDRLTPDLDEVKLMEYFRSRKPSGLDDETLTRLSCIGFARLIMGELGGPEKARIIWLDEHALGHAWVVGNDQEDTEKPYNNNLGLRQMKIEDATVGQLKREGIDLTDEILGEEWSRL